MSIFKSIAEWRKEIPENYRSERVELIEKRKGIKTIRVGGLLYHSQYNPTEEAKKLIEASSLDKKRPVVAIGLGLGYHIQELIQKEYKVIVIEPDKDIAFTAIQNNLLPDDLLLAIPDTLDYLFNDSFFKDYLDKIPQPFFHPVVSRIYSEFCETLIKRISRECFDRQHFNIAIVGPMYGGSLPITRYLNRAFRKLGHQTLLVDTEIAWNVFNSIGKTLKTPKMAHSLEDFYTKFLSEWCLAQVIEFQPEICIVMAQAPVTNLFVSRLNERGIVTAFWFVENWRHLSYWKEIAPFYNLFFHIQPGEFDNKLDAIGCHCHFPIFTACDPELHAPVSLSPDEEKIYKCDLSFAGAGYYNRIKMLKGLTDYNLKIWGVNWNELELLPHVVEGNKGFDTEEYMKIVAGSKINLNLHSSVIHEGVDPDADAINPRVFEIASAGGFQLCDPCKGLEDLFDTQNEIPTYTDLKTLRDKIDYFLKHEEERQQIAQNAQKRALKEHTYEHRANQMLDYIKEFFGGKIMRKGMRIQRTVGEIIERYGKNSPLGQWLATLPQDIPFLQEEINKHLPILDDNTPFPVQIFWYLNEVRVFGENLLREK